MDMLMRHNVTMYAHCLSYILINFTSIDSYEHVVSMRPVHVISTGVQTPYAPCQEEKQCRM
jgi:hypothetical protein